jgi:hypothetical protein
MPDKTPNIHARLDRRRVRATRDTFAHLVVDIDVVSRSIELGEERICPGEFGREARGIAIALRESHRRGHVRVDLPLEDRSLRLGGV